MVNALKAKLGAYRLASITPDLVAGYRDARLDGGKGVANDRGDVGYFQSRATAVGHRTKSRNLAPDGGLFDSNP